MLFYVFLSIILKNLQDIMSNVTMHVQVASFIIVIWNYEEDFVLWVDEPTRAMVSLSSRKP